jgi:hypothetical protein
MFLGTRGAAAAEAAHPLSERRGWWEAGARREAGARHTACAGAGRLEGLRRRAEGGTDRAMLCWDRNARLSNNVERRCCTSLMPAPSSHSNL